MPTYRHTIHLVDIQVGARLRLRREAMGVSQTKLGRSIGVSFSQIQKYERGTNRIGAGALWHFARELGVEVGYFFDGLAEPVPAPEGNLLVNQLAGKLSLLPERKLVAIDALVSSCMMEDAR